MDTKKLEKNIEYGQSIKINDFSLDDYVHWPPMMTNDRDCELKTLIGRIRGGAETDDNVFNVEQQPLRRLLLEQAEYPEINPDFLSS